MTVQQAIGDIIGVPIPAASGLQLSMRYWRAYTFITFEDDGSTIITFTQHPTTAGAKTANTASEAALAITNAAYKFPGVGGTASAGPTPSGGAYDLADDTTNDAMAITVRADQLSDGYEFIEATVDGGILIAIPHAPRHMLPATSIPSPLTHP